jgi:hypothetical protein
LRRRRLTVSHRLLCLRAVALRLLPARDLVLLGGHSAGALPLFGLVALCLLSAGGLNVGPLLVSRLRAGPPVGFGTGLAFAIAPACSIGLALAPALTPLADDPDRRLCAPTRSEDRQQHSE